jgi:flagellar L-ring protein precursor FlgH
MKSSGTPLALTAARRMTRCTAAALLALACGACSHLSKAPTVDFVEPPATPRPTATPVRTPSNTTGSLFQSVSYRPGFEDVRARQIGDTVTIQMVENVSASQKSLSTIDRTAANSAGISAFPLLNAGDLAKASVGATSGNSFSGKGGTESTNTFSGTITTTVIEVRPNGHLVVAGDKQIGVNQNVDVLRFSGTVDPRLVQPGSVVNSTQVANVRIESKGRGAQDEAQTIGWLSRFFLTVLPF